MLTQTFLTEQLRMEQNAKEFFIDDIISGDVDKDLNMFVSRGKILGFDMTLNRIAIVIKLYDMEGKHLKKNKKLLLSQQRRELVLRKLQNSFTNPQNMMSYKGSDNFVILYVIDSLEYEDFKAQILKDVESFEKAFKKSPLEYRLGVGCFYPEITGLRKSYKEAVKTITLCDMIYRDAPDRNVVFAYDLALETMLASLPDHIYHAYSYKIMAKSSNKDLLSQDKLIRTLNAFFDNNLNSTLAAESLDITRNTMNNRLNTIKNITYLDPKNFNDAIKLKVLIALNEIKEFFNQS